MRVEISHFELGCRLKPGDYPLSYYVVVGDVLNDYIAIDGHVCPDNTDQNKPVPFWQVLEGVEDGAGGVGGAVA